MVYKIIYYFEVLGKIAEGKNVRFLNRKENYVGEIKDLSVRDFTIMMKHVENNEKENRYEFWIEENMEEEVA